MNKDQRAHVVEYVGQLSDDDLCLLGLRLTERLGGDFGEAMEFLSRDEKVDAYLSATATAAELYDAAEKVKDILLRECKKRGVALKWGPRAA